MRLACVLFALWLAGATLPAVAQDVRYVSDELAVLLRAAPDGESASRGVVTSGARLTVLEGGGASGYVRVRTADGREGWLLGRFLQAQPIARERLQRTEKELATTQAELRQLKAEHERLTADFERISGGQPMAEPDVVAALEQAREKLRKTEAEIAQLREGHDEQRGTQRTLLIGGGLVAGGALLALLIRVLWPRRRWSDL